MNQVGKLIYHICMNFLLLVPQNDVDLDSENGLRRACSLSDLTDPSPSKEKSAVSPGIVVLSNIISLAVEWSATFAYNIY